MKHGNFAGAPTELKRETQIEIDETPLFIKETIPRKFNIVGHIE